MLQMKQLMSNICEDAESNKLFCTQVAIIGY
jgi:hypothetical protein